MKIIGYYCNNSGLLINSEGQYVDKAPYLDFLLQDSISSTDKIIQVFYNINYNVANILKAIHLTKEQGKILNDTEELYIPPYKLKYVQGKFFSIKKGSYFCNLSDISQYYNTKTENDNLKADCYMHAIKARDIGYEVFNGMIELELNPTTITSPIRAFEKEKLEKLDLPTLEDIPDKVIEMADECCDASWLEGYRIGHYDKVYDYDLVSAYPYQTSLLEDIRLGHWEEVDKFDTKGKYGYYLCRVEIYPTTMLSPIMYVIKNNNNDYNKNYTPTGSWYRVLTKKQIEFIYHWNIGTVDIMYGVTWIRDSYIGSDKELHPFKSTMDWLFTEKQKSSGQKRENVKRISSGIYGKMREVRRNKNPETGKQEKIYGQFANQVYAAEIEVNTKLEDADFILRNNLRCVHIAVDGIVSLDEVKDESQLRNNELGGWRLNNENKCISISTGVIAIKGKFDDNPEEKKDFSLEYDWLLQQIKEQPDSQVYVMRKKSPVSLAIATKDDGKRWSELGQLQNVTRSINIGYEEKRMYKEKPKCGKDVLECDKESFPLDITVLKNMSEGKE